MAPPPPSGSSPSGLASSSFPHLDTTSIRLSSPPQLPELSELDGPDGPDSSSRPVSLGFLSYYTGSPDSSAYLARLPSVFPAVPHGDPEGTQRTPTQAEVEAAVGARWNDTHDAYWKPRGEMGAVSLSPPASMEALRPQGTQSQPRSLAPMSAPGPASQPRMTGRQASTAQAEEDEVPPPLPPKPYPYTSVPSVPSPTTSSYTTHTHHTHHTTHTHHTHHTNRTNHTHHTQHTSPFSHPQTHLDPLPTPYSVRSFSALSHSSSSSEIGAIFPRAQIARMASAAQVREFAGASLRGGAGAGYTDTARNAPTLDTDQGSGSGSGSGSGTMLSSVSLQIGDHNRGVTSPEDQAKKRGMKKMEMEKEEEKEKEKPLPVHPEERFSVADTFANHSSTSTTGSSRVAGLGLGLNFRPSVEVDPERIDLALGSLPWPELPFRDPASPGSPLPPSSAVSAPAGGHRLQTNMGSGSGSGTGTGKSGKSGSGSASASANTSGSGSASRGFWAKKSKKGGIFATLQGELIGTREKDTDQYEENGGSRMMRDGMGADPRQQSAQREGQWRRDDGTGPGPGSGSGHSPGLGLGLGLGLGSSLSSGSGGGSGSGFGPSSSSPTSTTTTRPDPRPIAKGREKDLPIPALPAYTFLSSDPLPEGLPSAISSDRGGSRSQSRLSSRSSTSISTAGVSAGAGASQSQIQIHSQSSHSSHGSLGRSFSHTRSFSRGNKPAPSPLSLGFLPQHDVQDQDEFHRFPGLRTADGSSTSASSQTSPWSLSRDPSELDDRRLSVPYSPTLAHGASLDWQRPYPPEVVPGGVSYRSVGDHSNPYDREDMDEYRFSGMSFPFPVDRPGSGSAWSGMADIETGPSRDVSRESRISWATSANHDHARDRDHYNPSRNKSTKSTKSTKSIRSAKSIKSAKSIRSKHISATSTSTSAHRTAYGSRRWEIARQGEDGEGVALVGRGGSGGEGDGRGGGEGGAEEEMELGALVGRAAVLERLLRQGKRVSAQSILLHHAARPFSPFATSRPSSRFSRGPSRLSHAPSTKHHSHVQGQAHDRPALSALIGFSGQAVQTVGGSRAGAKSSASTRTGGTGTSSRKSLSTSLRYRLSRKIRRNRSREDTFTEISGDYETDDPDADADADADAEDEVDRLGRGRGGLDEDDDPSLFPPSSRPISGVPLSARDRPSYEPNYGVTLGLPQHPHLEGTPRSSGIGNGNGNGRLRGLLHSGILIFGEEDDPPPPTPPKPARLRTRLAEALVPRPPGCVSDSPVYTTLHHSHGHGNGHHGAGGVAVQGSYRDHSASGGGGATSTLGSPFMYTTHGIPPPSPGISPLPSPHFPTGNSPWMSSSPYGSGSPESERGQRQRLITEQEPETGATASSWRWEIWGWPWARRRSRRTRRTGTSAHDSRNGKEGNTRGTLGGGGGGGGGGGSLEWEEQGLHPELSDYIERDADADIGGGVRVRPWARTQSPRSPRSHLGDRGVREKPEKAYGSRVLQRSKGVHGVSGWLSIGQWEDAGARRRWVWGVVVGCGVVGVLVVGLLAGILGRKG